MPDALFALLLGLVAAVYVALPLRGAGPATTATATPDVREPLRLRYRLALDAIRDVEADRRAGSLDEETYRAQRADAEAHAVRTLRGLEEAQASAPADQAPGAAGGGSRVAVAIGLGLAAAVAVGFVLPAPIGLANPTVENRALAEAQAAEADRQAQIAELQDRLALNARDPDALSALADAYLAGDSGEELVRAAVVLLALIELEPENESAYTRLITAYVRAGDYEDAAAATDALAHLNPNSADVPFFRGLIARGEGDAAGAVEAFDAFLRLAPDDPRAPMVRSLRAQAAGEIAD